MKIFIIFVALMTCFVFSNQNINATGFEDLLPLRSKSLTLNEGGITYNTMQLNLFEIWKPIKNYETHFEVSNYGNIKSATRTIKCIGGFTRLVVGRNRKLGDNGKGYKFVPLTISYKSINHYVHRLVATNFVVNPEKKPFVNHIDGNKGNNFWLNLEWVTRQENADHAKEIGLMNYGEDHHNTNLTNKNAEEIRILHKTTNISISQLAKDFSSSSVAIWRILNYKSFYR